MRKNNKKIIFFIGLAILIGLGSFLTGKFLFSNNALPENKSPKYLTRYTDEEKELYYEIFNKTKILDGSEDTAEKILFKLDQRFEEKERDFKDLTNLEGVYDKKMLKAVFMMNFVSFTNPYGTPDIDNNPKNIQTLIWKIKNANCQTNVMLMQMLLEKAGYEAKTVTINGKSHGYNEVKVGWRWHILDATTNIWINRSTQELMDGKKGDVRKFFVDETDVENPSYSSENNPSDLRTKMVDLGQGFRPIISGYDYLDLKEWQY